MDKKSISYNKMYLLHKVLKEKKDSINDQHEKHNMLIRCKLINDILNYGIDYMINKTKGNTKFKEVDTSETFKRNGNVD